MTEKSRIKKIENGISKYETARREQWGSLYWNKKSTNKGPVRYVGK